MSLAPKDFGVSQKGGRGLANGVSPPFFSENEWGKTEENRQRKGKKAEKKTNKMEENAEKKKSENKEKTGKSEATPFQQPLSPNPENCLNFISYITRENQNGDSRMGLVLNCPHMPAIVLILRRKFLLITNGPKRPDHTPSTAGTFRKKFRKDPGNALRAFPGIPLKSTPQNKVFQNSTLETIFCPFPMFRAVQDQAETKRAGGRVQVGGCGGGFLFGK